MGKDAWLQVVTHALVHCEGFRALDELARRTVVQELRVEVPRVDVDQRGR